MSGQICFKNLSNEVILLIFESFTDFRSLESLALTCRTAHELFDTKKHLLTKKILINLIGPNLLPEACWAWLCSPIEYPAEYVSNAHVVQFEDVQYELLRMFAASFSATRVRELEDIQISYEDARELAEFHLDTLEPLFERFIRHCMKMNDGPLSQSLDDIPVTDLEKDRIMRAFYRWELFCKLYGARRGDVGLHTEPGLLEQFHGPFFQRFAPWEIVQMSCIHDFLVRELGLCWRNYQLRQHPDLTQSWVNLIRDRFVPYSEIQGYLSMGLTWVNNLLNIPSPLEQAHIARFGHILRSNHASFWYSAMCDRAFSTPSAFVDNILDNNAAFDDGDFGAETLWDYRGHLPAVNYPLYDDYDWGHRGWGYMFWDRQRLADLNAFANIWGVRETARRMPVTEGSEDGEIVEPQDDGQAQETEALMIEFNPDLLLGPEDFEVDWDIFQFQD